MTQMSEERRDEGTFAIIGAAMEGHGELGAGFLEAVHLMSMGSTPVLLARLEQLNG
jgi:hypothetical protein